MSSKQPLEWPEELADVIVVGVGIAGSAAAVAFSKLGYKVLALERSLKEPNRIVGELLQPGGVEQLRKLGMEEVLRELILQLSQAIVSSKTKNRSFCLILQWQGMPSQLDVLSIMEDSSKAYARSLRKLQMYSYGKRQC